MRRKQTPGNQLYVGHRRLRQRGESLYRKRQRLDDNSVIKRRDDPATHSCDLESNAAGGGPVSPPSGAENLILEAFSRPNLQAFRLPFQGITFSANCQSQN
jgi:hypothetical protein